MSSDDKQGKLRLSLVDVLDSNIGGRASVRLRHQVLSDSRVINNADASKRINIPDLFGTPQGLYRVEVDPLAYLPTSQFVNLKASDITDLKITFAIDPNKVKSVTFPLFSELSGDQRALMENSDGILSLEGLKGEALYNAEGLGDLRRANILNLTKKCGATPLDNGKTVLPSIRQIKEIRGDRFFVVVPKELREETKHSALNGLFTEVPEVLHTPPLGFTHAGSFKTRDKFGNLQLTYFMKGDDCVADIDIDPVSGLEHMFQVIEHKIKGIETHPYAVHEVLIEHQKLDPGYRFVV